MSRTSWIILGLITLTAVIGLTMSGDPEQAARMEQMQRDAAFSGSTRDLVLLLLAIGLAGFIGYLALTRR